MRNLVLWFDNFAVGEPAGMQRPCDFNQDGNLDISDSVGSLTFLFLGGSPPPCGDGTLDDAANRTLLDANGDDRVDLSDAVYKLTFLFLGGPPPASGTRCIRIARCPDVCDEDR